MLIVATFPVAPPRLMDLGFVDTVTLRAEAYRVLQPPSLTNQYAAMPSFHVGWDLLVGIALVREGRRTWTRVVGTAAAPADAAHRRGHRQPLPRRRDRRRRHRADDPVAVHGLGGAAWRDRGRTRADPDGARQPDDAALDPPTPLPKDHHERRPRQSLAHQGLVRPREGKILGGVCAGLGRRFGLTPWVSRLLFVLILMVVPGSQLLIYPVLWILMPAEETVTYPVAATPSPAA